ncbi:MAG: hypothetical protein EDS66_02940 [Planctomycetota bacterium]|nr:MAG: hypothetical protein EDS66_02940 [Planctomycetota bacterium]
MSSLCAYTASNSRPSAWMNASITCLPPERRKSPDCERTIRIPGCARIASSDRLLEPPLAVVRRPMKYRNHGKVRRSEYGTRLG